MDKITCFKAYDVRGQLGTELNEDISYRIGRAFGQFLRPQNIVVGGDIRLTSESLKAALTEGLRDSGVNVTDIGMTGTEEIYFATSYLNMDGGVEVTASHNPMDYNGMKLVREQSKPISGDTGLKDIQRLAEENNFPPVGKRGGLTRTSVLEAYVDHMMSYIEPLQITPLTLVVNAGNGSAGPVVDALEQKFNDLNIPITLIKIHHDPDGTFPNGIPNPLLVENRQDTSDAVLQHGADMGIAWDGDFDRCFLFDENGDFIEGYYIVGMLAEAFLQKNSGATVIHDPRVTWNTIDLAEATGGTAVQSKTGHAFMKERMRAEDAIYGGEMSAHHYFRDFAYCDSGMIPWMLVSEMLCVKKMKLSEMVSERIRKFPSSGEINSKITDPKGAIDRVLNAFKGEAENIDHTDGISVECADWRFNLRSSNTEPVVRLNVESRGDEALTEQKTQEILTLLRQDDQ